MRWSKALGPPVDLLIRTGGERRLSDFLLWESAYAELVFTRTMWPDFGVEDLASAVRDFAGPGAPLRRRATRAGPLAGGVAGLKGIRSLPGVHRGSYVFSS